MKNPTPALRYVGHLPRSNPDMFWVVEMPWSTGTGVSFFYYPDIESVLAKYPGLQGQLSVAA